MMIVNARFRVSIATVIALSLLGSAPILAQERNVLTQHNDNARSGAYLAETRLTPATVSSGLFGPLYMREVSGDVLAQPLYVEQVPTSRGLKNMFFIATALNVLYGFDADSPDTSLAGGSIWTRTLCGSFDV